MIDQTLTAGVLSRSRRLDLNLICSSTVFEEPFKDDANASDKVDVRCRMKR